MREGDFPPSNILRFRDKYRFRVETKLEAKTVQLKFERQKPGKPHNTKNGGIS